jgi:hypothetical protein
MQDKAVRFLRDVVGDPGKAEEFDALSPEEYAEHKRITIKNPFSVGSLHHRRRMPMARQSYSELKDRVAELEEENQELTDKLDSILDIVSEEDEDDQGDED